MHQVGWLCGAGDTATDNDGGGIRTDRTANADAPVGSCHCCNNARSVGDAPRRETKETETDFKTEARRGDDRVNLRDCSMIQVQEPEQKLQGLSLVSFRELVKPKLSFKWTPNYIGSSAVVL
ncbi:hypothetical protein HRR82_000234 [Exophiala dermatitidis]|nr:hypothetical protein HRR79_000848 [Exophiala dermatitidis]KAJ4589833.1 hypothetical protein HRR82_000234 [Exophiala dermatitidis]